MDITITITVTVPTDGTQPNITINNDAKPKVADTKPHLLSADDIEALSTEIWGRFKSLAISRGEADDFPRAQLIPKEKPPRKKVVYDLPEKPCPQCGDMFKPRVARQKFHNKKCKDNYYRAQEALKREAAAPVEVKLAKAPKSKPTPVKEVAVEPQHIPDITVSKDDFYQEQLKKAAKKSPGSYGKYLSRKDIDDLKTA